jgi:hypothetical protein
MHVYSNSGRVAAAEETPHFVDWWVLAILWRSQHMCLFSKSREVLWVRVVNIGAVLKDLWLFFCGEFINFTLELFLVLTKYVLTTSSRSNCAVTIHWKFPTLLTWPLHHIDSMSFIPFGKWGWRGVGVESASLPKNCGRHRKKISGSDAALK